MKGVTAIYLGRIVPKENFRTFIYHPEYGRRLVESWDEFEAHMETGIWFATKEGAQEVKETLEKALAEPDEKPKRSRKKKEAKSVEKEQDTDEVAFDEAMFPVNESALGHEVKPEDDFLSHIK